MTVRDWTFTPLGFKVLWRAMERDVLPYPLQYRSTERTLAEYDQAWKDEAGALHRQLDDWLRSALGILAQPEARIQVAGFLGKTKLRVHVAVRHQHAVWLRQEPTDDPDRGGAVHMSMMDADYVSRRVADLLPPARRGSGPGLEVSRHDLEDGADDDRPYYVGSRSPRQEAAQFFERPRPNVVHVAVYAGAAWDNRPAPSRGFHVMDYPDGRYLVRSSGTISAVPADALVITDNLDRAMRATVEGFREENDQGYRSYA
ncbi:ESX secretion-associated protein EspG [Nocardia pseudovaccinii]|uniref:ESX secretion-associated protein EspG n=1 Tax=Nocardia pseudovaccinii TaxID=189540 RepID=UPI0007A53FC1|nr:ESX secretion-associated protein EspG [Nocardia pseudovaccinii]